MPTDVLLDDDLGGPDARSPDDKVFDERSIWIATALGTPVASGALMYYNAGKLDRGEGLRHLLVCGAILLATFAIGFALPEEIPGLLFTAAQLFAVNAYFQRAQKSAVTEHTFHGGGIQSRWVAAGVGLLGLLLFGGLLLAVLYLSDETL